MNQTPVYEAYDIAVIGAGHAGCEAALAAARLGMETLMLTVSMDSIAMMPCNPNIGGTSKGHLVREIDALGGEMGKNIDKTYLQSKMLNRSKGPAVHSLRAQADKQAYSAEMRRVVENTPHLTLRQAEVVEIITEPVAELAAGGGTTPGKADRIPAEVAFAGGTEDRVASAGGTEDKVAFAGGTADKVAFAGGTEDKVASAGGTAGGRRQVTGIRLLSGAIYPCRAVILCTGVYLKARCITGEVSMATGPNGLPAATHLSESLRALGIELLRFKTGTPARIDKRSIDFSKLEVQTGDEPITPFSFTNTAEDIAREQVPCWLTYTNAQTHEIIRRNLHRSPLFSGVIEGTGPRYCPSIEDKVVRFADKERHQIFIEPEGEYTNEMYLSGMSSSLPEDVQVELYRTVAGLEHARIVRNAYAIEYDCLNATQLTPALELKAIDGLFSAGQANGSSGYEEAAAQGLLAGINAARRLSGREPLILSRDQAYIGVLIDDLVTKETSEPYRMMTSRAEYRLLLRQDNADLRLTRLGHEIGLIDETRFAALLEKEAAIKTELARLEQTRLVPSEALIALLEQVGSTKPQSGITLAELLRRPELSYELLAEFDTGRPALSASVQEQVTIMIKYAGYIERQCRQVEQMKRLEKRLIPQDLDYEEISSLRLEARQKLMKIRPISIGQASRISGVSPADISVLLLYLNAHKRASAYPEAEQ